MKTVEEMELLRIQLAQVLYEDMIDKIRETTPFRKLVWDKASGEIKLSFERQAAVVFDFLFKQHPITIIEIFVEDPIAKIVCEQILAGTAMARSIEEDVCLSNKVKKNRFLDLTDILKGVDKTTARMKKRQLAEARKAKKDD